MKYKNNNMIHQSEQKWIDLSNENTRLKVFLAKMSHEIRTPMNAILGMAELALREEMSDVVREHTQVIKQAGTNLLTIINDILDFSKIESGQLVILPEEYMFSSLINDVINIIKMRALDSQLKFTVNVDSHIPNALFGDSIRIRQIMLNILNNAVKYTEKGFVSLTVTGEIKDNIVNLNIEIEDSGKGIKKENVRKLFEEFAQFDLENNKGIEGTGLGLAITQSLVKTMNGQIHVVSEYGKGSIFTVKLPQKILDTRELAFVDTPHENSILIFEQREICLDSIIHTIDDLGISYKSVSSSFEFYDELKSDHYSFVFVAASLYKNVKKIYEVIDAKAKIVIIAEFGEIISDVIDRNVTVLTTPIYSIPVANIINGVSDDSPRSSDEEIAAGFTAPDAIILIVDDIPTNLHVAKGFLLPYKMQIDLCESGMKAIEAVKTRQYDLIFMDHMMPEMNGIEATLHIRDWEQKNVSSESANVPIIALTANAVSGTKETFLENGFNDFLSKPLDKVILNAILEKWIPEKKQRKKAKKTVIVKDHDVYAGVDIVGVDTAKGIAISGGTVCRYMQTLDIFYKDSQRKIDDIKTCLKDSNLALYINHIHALKSASANIGAIELSGLAKDLEKAGLRADWDFILEHNVVFLAYLEALVNNIHLAVLAYDSKKENKPVDMVLLKNELSALMDAMTVFDVLTINKAAKNLSKFTQIPDIGDTVGKILENKMTGDYDEAALLIGALLGKLSAEHAIHP
ncbi:MAG: response regulator [Treponema sp.]|nr:response regulator [Treponema sp.]